MLQYVMNVFLGGMLLFCSFKLSSEEIALTTDEQLSSAQKQAYVVQWARDHLPQVGVLTEEKRGFVYLKVDDGYINLLFDMLPHDAYSKPPFFRRGDSPGAHISVFYADERSRTGPITEIGRRYSFTPTHFALVPPKTREYMILQVESAELEQLRRKYGLSALLKGHEFHITVAKKKRRSH